MTQGSCEAPSVLAAPVTGQVASVAGASSGARIKEEWGWVKEELNSRY